MYQCTRERERKSTWRVLDYLLRLQKIQFQYNQYGVETEEEGQQKQQKWQSKTVSESFQSRLTDAIPTHSQCRVVQGLPTIMLCYAVLCCAICTIVCTVRTQTPMYVSSRMGLSPPSYLANCLGILERNQSAPSRLTYRLTGYLSLRCSPG